MSNSIAAAINAQRVTLSLGVMMDLHLGRGGGYGG